MAKKKQHSPKRSLPQYCDFSCPYATFTEPETAGACRRDVPVYCTLFKKFNAKHALCLEKKQ